MRLSSSQAVKTQLYKTAVPLYLSDAKNGHYFNLIRCNHLFGFF